MYHDPSGHFGILAGAAAGFAIFAGVSMISDAISGEFSLKNNWRKYLGAGAQGAITLAGGVGSGILRMAATGVGKGLVGNTANQVIRNSGFDNFSAKELAVSSVATGVAFPAGGATSGIATKAVEKFSSQTMKNIVQNAVIGTTATTAGAFTGNVTDQTWDISSGVKNTFDTGSLIRDTGLGFITGFGFGAGFGFISAKLPTNKINVKKPTNQVTESATDNSANSKAEQIKINKAQGDAFEQVVKQELLETQDNVVQQITVKTQSGIKTKLDLVGINKQTGIIELTEAKSSVTAPLTPNQKTAFPEIAETGAIVVGKGKAPFTGGTLIPAIKVKIVRPNK